MYRLANPDYIYALAAIPAFVLLYWLVVRWRRKTLSRYGEISLVSRLMPGISKAKRLWKFILLSIAFGLVVTGIANPQIGTKLEEAKREGVDIIIALDVSNSMKAEDIRPNRLERSKHAIYRMIDNLENDRIGLIVFAGKAYVQLPLTSDYGAAKLFLSTVDTDIIPVQGTAIGDAIDLAMTSYGTDDKRNKALVIITDGENHEDDAVSAAKKAEEKGIIIHTIGMGSPSGTPIPVFQNHTRTGFKKDASGNTVLTKLDESILMQVAAAGKGQYVRATNSDDGLKIILGEIMKMEKKQYGVKVFTDYIDRFQYFLAAALVLLVMEFFISERKSKWLEKLNLFGEVKR